MNENLPSVQAKSESVADIASLLRALESREPVTRERALQTLRDMGPDGVRALARFASGITASENEDDATRRMRFVATLIILFLPSLVYGFFVPVVPIIWGTCCGLIYLLGQSVFEGAKEERQAQTRKWRTITTAFSAFNDIGCVGALVAATNADSLTVRAAARSALKRLLPRLTPENSEALTQVEREFLTGELSSTTMYQDADYLIAILHSVSIIGPERAIPRVYQLLHSYTHPTETHRVRAAARRCFEQMALRATWPDVSQTANLLEDFTIYAPDTYVKMPLNERLVESLRLIHVLNRLMLEDSVRLDKAARTKIYAILHDAATSIEATYPPSILMTPELLIACLRVIEQLRDTVPVQTVRFLALRDAATVNQKAVRSAAVKCLRVLDVEVEKGIAGKTLLRASSGPQAASEELLRAAQASKSQTQSEQLLRADVGIRRE